MDDDPSSGGSGCFRYNGATGIMQFSDDCVTYYNLVEEADLWNQLGADSISYGSGSSTAIGINNNSPAYTLDVNGSVHITDQLILDPTATGSAPSFLSLDELEDVSTTGASSGDTLVFDGSDWLASAGGGGSSLWYQSTTDIYYSSGNVGIGKSGPIVALDVVGDINYTGVLTDVSDRRKKENIEPLANASAGILGLNGYSFTMIGDEKHSVEYGLMAQDVEPVFPELVKTDAEGFKSLNYMGLIAPMIETMKTQQATIMQQNEKIDALMARIDALEANQDLHGAE